MRASRRFLLARQVRLVVVRRSLRDSGPGGAGIGCASVCAVWFQGWVSVGRKPKSDELEAASAVKEIPKAQGRRRLSAPKAPVPRAWSGGKDDDVGGALGRTSQCVCAYVRACYVTYTGPSDPVSLLAAGKRSLSGGVARRSCTSFAPAVDTRAQPFWSTGSSRATALGGGRLGLGRRRRISTAQRRNGATAGERSAKRRPVLVGRGVRCSVRPGLLRGEMFSGTMGGCGGLPVSIGLIYKALLARAGQCRGPVLPYGVLLVLRSEVRSTALSCLLLPMISHAREGKDVLYVRVCTGDGGTEYRAGRDTAACSLHKCFRTY